MANSQDTNQPVAYSATSDERLMETPKQEQSERNFCERCGKRLFDGIHTCTPPAKQEPVAVVTGVYGGRFTYQPLQASVILPVGMALYSSPQQRKPLTDEQIEKIIKANMNLQMNLAGIGQDFEAAHNIKE
jgi:hypothetical protein